MLNKNIIGENLKAIRIKKGITQDQLSAKLQIRGLRLDRTTISKIEINNRKVLDYELLLISECLNIDVNELFFKGSK